MTGLTDFAEVITTIVVMFLNGVFDGLGDVNRFVRDGMSASGIPPPVQTVLLLIGAGAAMVMLTRVVGGISKMLLLVAVTLVLAHMIVPGQP